MLLKLLFCQLPKWETKQLKTLSPQKMYPSCQSFCTIPNIIKPNMIQSLITISQETQILDRIKRSKISKIPSVANPHNPTTIIIGDLWITELDTVTLFVRHGQMTHFGVYPWVFSFSIWPGQGFYVELFSIYAFASEYQTKMKRPFLLFFQCK